MRTVSSWEDDYGVSKFVVIWPHIAATLGESQITTKLLRRLPDNLRFHAVLAIVIFLINLKKANDLNQMTQRSTIAHSCIALWDCRHCTFYWSKILEFSRNAAIMDLYHFLYWFCKPYYFSSCSCSVYCCFRYNLKNLRTSNNSFRIWSTSFVSCVAHIARQQTSHCNNIKCFINTSGKI